MIYVIFQDRLGNNLFQFYAALSIDENVSICACDSEIYETTIKYKDIFFKDIPLLDHVPEGVKVYNEPFFHFSKIPYLEDEDLAIKGYFQSYRYIDQKKVLNRLKTPDFVQSFIKSNYPEILNKKFTSVHIRRGDYLNVLYEHPVCSLKFYRDAIANIGYKEKYVFISDDIAWCKKNFKGNNFIFIESSNPLIDFFIPCFCKNNIISNSSFGWWGAFLNRNPKKLVIAPSLWFGFRNKNNIKDLIPSDWKIFPSKLSFFNYVRSKLQFILHHIRFRLGIG
jgi:hypothetical protein